jgi:hypothetical protein
MGWMAVTPHPLSAFGTPKTRRHDQAHLLWWGVTSTVFGKPQLDQHPELHGAQAGTLKARKPSCVYPIGDIGPTRSASFPTDVHNVLTRCGPPRRHMHNIREDETSSRGEDSLESGDEDRQGVLTPAGRCALAWGASFSGTVGLQQRGVVQSRKAHLVYRILAPCQVKNSMIPSLYEFFSNPPQRVNFIVSFRSWFLPPHLRRVGFGRVPPACG